ncbi:MAG: hypothetical protein L0229_18220, partial [Blastocatellia bacterium]|nr:hypothetical protein [Blastocatellia bacterium]
KKGGALHISVPLWKYFHAGPARSIYHRSSAGTTSQSASEQPQITHLSAISYQLSDHELKTEG